MPPGRFSSLPVRPPRAVGRNAAARSLGRKRASASASDRRVRELGTRILRRAPRGYGFRVQVGEFPKRVDRGRSTRVFVDGEAGAIYRSPRYLRKTSMANSPSPIRRLETYWKIEAGNAVVIPALAVYLVLESGGRISTALVLSGLACSFLLVIGTIVLRKMLLKARGEASAFADRIPLLLRLRWPAIALCVAAAAAIGTEWLSGGLELSAQCVAPAVLLLLALLEYVNYYHIQLQHFDHAPDWQRLVSGRGFRRSHLAREIDRWKREQRHDA